MALPQEILDNIVDELSDDACSLTICSASSRLLHYRAVTQLFTDVSLHPANYKAFIDLAVTSPYIAKSVQTLRLNGGPLKRDQYFTTDTDLPLALQKLVNVRNLHVRSAFLGQFLALRNPLLHRSLLALPLSSIHLDEVYFNDSGDLLEMVSLISSLRRLHVGAVVSTPTPTPATPGEGEAVGLTELCVDMGTSGSIVHTLLSIPLGNLETLEVNGCSAYDIATINGVLARCPVKTLIVGKSHLCTSFQRTFWMRDGGGGGGGQGPGLDICRLRNLEVTVRDLYTQLQWWVDALRGVKVEDHPQLEAVTINLEITSKTVQPRSWFQPARWRALDEAVSRLDSLRRFIVRVNPGLLEAFSAIIGDECGGMIGRGIVDIIPQDVISCQR
ncbi:hypothetical protein BDZ89DRAFT_1058830 [Hymenopellis radicata]|nr:hypothetical protein BDZ89DRAFT_1058830 [Hymenopellis radicata]